jgi:uncharacterized Zn finger protein
MQKVGENAWGEPIVWPVCPDCGADNLRNIVTSEGIRENDSPSDYKDPPFIIVNCGLCGHVYGVIPTPKDYYGVAQEKK